MSLMPGGRRELYEAMAQIARDRQRARGADREHGVLDQVARLKRFRAGAGNRFGVLELALR